MPKGVPADLVGRRFGAWLVLRKGGTAQSGVVMWTCRCDCGHEADVSTSNITRGKSTRCRACSNRLFHANRRASK